ncbi:hypothetical protein DL96DRAFT_711879 [Flagelloscypha sp. PMI_526]|nr:hypothetical protein DL96DRAFT_711879 [Flagelloscypha sp. PMI_526]
MANVLPSQDFQNSDIQSGQGGAGSEAGVGGRGGDIASHNTTNIENIYHVVIVTQAQTDYVIKEQNLKGTMVEVEKLLSRIKEDPEPHLEPPLKVEPLTKVFTIYTGVDQATKKLKRSTDLVLTLTPAASDPERPWATIVWKVLHFEKLSAMKSQVTWSAEAGFCVLQEEDDGTLTPGPLRMPAKPGHATILREVEEGSTTESYLDSEVKIKDTTDDIAIANTTDTPQRLALCTIDPKKHEADRFSPVANISLFGRSGPEDQSGKFALQCGPPVLLQVYAFNGYKERQPFQNDDGKAKPIFTKNLSTVRSGVSFRLYSKPSGHITLE